MVYIRVLARIGTEWVFLEDYLQIYAVERTSDSVKITSNTWIIGVKTTLWVYLALKNLLNVFINWFQSRFLNGHNFWTVSPILML